MDCCRPSKPIPGRFLLGKGSIYPLHSRFVFGRCSIQSGDRRPRQLGRGRDREADTGRTAVPPRKGTDRSCSLAEPPAVTLHSVLASLASEATAGRVTSNSFYQLCRSEVLVTFLSNNSITPVIALSKSCFIFNTGSISGIVDVLIATHCSCLSGTLLVVIT